VGGGGEKDFRRSKSRPLEGSGEFSSAVLKKEDEQGLEKGGGEDSRTLLKKQGGGTLKIQPAQSENPIKRVKT